MVDIIDKSSNYGTKPNKRSSEIIDKALEPKRTKQIYWGLAITIIALITLPMVINYVTTGSYLGLGDIEDETLHIGYYQIRLIGINDTGDEYDLTGQVKLYNYYTQEYLSDFVADGETIGQTTNVTIAYIYNITSDDYDLEWKNYSFVIFANEKQSDPFINTIVLERTVIAGDLSVNIYDLNDIRGTYDVADLQVGIENNFTLSLSSNNANKSIGFINYIPIDQRIDNVSYTALWLEIDTPIKSILINGYTPSLNITIDDKSYFVMPTLIFGNTIEIAISIEFVADLPTEFKFYDGIPSSENLILTI